MDTTTCFSGLGLSMPHWGCVNTMEAPVPSSPQRLSSGGAQNPATHSSTYSLPKQTSRDGAPVSSDGITQAGFGPRATSLNAGGERSSSKAKASASGRLQAPRTALHRQGSGQPSGRSARPRRSEAGSFSSGGADTANLSQLQSFAQMIDQRLGLALAFPAGALDANSTGSSEDNPSIADSSAQASGAEESDSSEEPAASKHKAKGKQGSKDGRPHSVDGTAFPLVPTLLSLLEDPETLTKMDRDEDDTAEFETYEGDGRPIDVPVDYGCTEKAIAQAEMLISQVEANPNSIPELKVKGHPVLAGVRAAHQLLHFNKRITQKRTLSNTAAFQSIASEPQASVDIALDHFLETAVRAGSMSDATRKKLVAVMRAEELGKVFGSVPGGAGVLSGLMGTEDQPAGQPRLPSGSLSRVQRQGHTGHQASLPAATAFVQGPTADEPGLLQPDHMPFSYPQQANLEQQVVNLDELTPTATIVAGSNPLMESMDSMDLKDLIMDELFPFTDTDGLIAGSKPLDPIDAAEAEPTLFQVDVRAIVTTAEIPAPPSRPTSMQGCAAPSGGKGYTLDAMAMAVNASKQAQSTSHGHAHSGTHPSTSQPMAHHTHQHNGFATYDATWRPPFNSTLELGASSTAAQDSSQLLPMTAQHTDRGHDARHKPAAQHQHALSHLLSSLPPFSMTTEAAGTCAPTNRMQHMPSSASSGFHHHHHPVELQDLAPVTAWLQGNALSKLTDRFGSASAGPGIPRQDGNWDASVPPARTISTYSSQMRQTQFSRPSQLELRQELPSTTSQPNAWAPQLNVAAPGRGKRTRCGSLLQHQLGTDANLGISASTPAVPLPSLADMMSNYLTPGGQHHSSTLDVATMQAMLDDLLPCDQDAQLQPLPLPRLASAHQPAPSFRQPSMTALPPHAAHSQTMHVMPPALNLAGSPKPPSPGKSRPGHMRTHRSDMHVWQKYPSCSAGAPSYGSSPAMPGGTGPGYSGLPTTPGMTSITGPAGPVATGVKGCGHSADTGDHMLASDSHQPPPGPMEGNKTLTALKIPNVLDKVASGQAPESPAMRDGRGTPKSKPSGTAPSSADHAGSPRAHRSPRNASAVVSPRSMLHYFLGKDGTVPTEIQPTSGAGDGTVGSSLAPGLPASTSEPVCQGAQASSAGVDATQLEAAEDDDSDEEHVIRPHNLRGGEMRKINKTLLQQVYHLPINEAAEQLGIGVTVLKKYCRKFEIDRWPYRKLKSMDKLMQSVEDQRHLDPTGSSYVLAELQRFKREVYENPEVCFDERIKKLRQANFKMEYKQRQALGGLKGKQEGGDSPLPASTSVEAGELQQAGEYLMSPR